MEKKIVLWMLGLSLLGLAIAIWLPGGRSPDAEPALPWKIIMEPDGGTRVFGLRLGVSTLTDARRRFAEPGSVNLFVSPDGRFDVESYFDGLYLSGLKANVVLSLEVSRDSAETMFDRGMRLSELGGGHKKVDLAPEDQTRVAAAPIASITYIPATDLSPDLLERLFGAAEQRLAEPGSPITHWLYPARGLDIAVNPEGREVFQYVHPAASHRLHERLDQATPPTTINDRPGHR
jgi:hypothetical protein